jgi:hypothetical protein
MFEDYDMYDFDGDDTIILDNVVIKKTLSKNILSGDFFDRVHFNLSNGKLECIMNDTVVQWVYLRLTVCEQMDC